jgi:hypothetical protein
LHQHASTGVGRSNPQHSDGRCAASSGWISKWTSFYSTISPLNDITISNQSPIRRVELVEASNPLISVITTADLPSSLTAALLTTSLSAAWLKSAGKGEAGILWHEFFDALISANPVQIQEAADRILTVGETSGGDALAGFVGVFMRWAELAHSNIPQFPS